MKIQGTLLLSLLLGACSAIAPIESQCKDNDQDKCKSVIVSKDISDSAGVHSGVLYSLPTQQLQFVLKREKVTNQSLKDARDKAKKAVEKIDEQIKSAQARVSHLETGEKLDKSVSAEKWALDLELAKLDLAIYKGKKVTADRALDKAKKSLAAFKTPYMKDSFSIKPSDPLPSADKRYVAQINNRATNATDIEIKTTKEGLLSTGSGTSEGNIDEIFVSFVSAVSAIKSGGRSVEKIQSLDQATRTCPLKPVTINYTIDMADPEPLKNLNKKLIEKEVCYELEKAGGTKSNKPATTNDIIYDGLLYPRVVPIKFNVFKTTKPTREYTESLYASVIDSNTLGVIPLRHGYFADNQYEFTFDNGLLTRYKAVNANELVAFFGMFVDAAKAVVSVPAEILQLKIDYSSKEEDYYNAKVAAREARLAYEKALLEEPDDTNDTDE